MKATVVVDNTAPVSGGRPFQGEHGFSLLLEHQSGKILFDMGQSAVVIHNLSLLKVPVSEIDMLVLSHGHYDHAGGLFHVLQHGRKRYPLYAHPDIFTPRYALGGGSRMYIGIPYSKDQLSTLGADWRLNPNPQEIAPGLWFSGQIKRDACFEPEDKRLVVCCHDVETKDGFPDDIALYYVSDKGLVVIGGCTHSGMINTIRQGMALTGVKQFYGWIGGTHLGPATSEQQERTLAELAAMKPEFIMTGHCTGFPMMAEMQRRFGDRFRPAHVGASIDF